MTEKTDHDILIAHDVKLTEICKTMGRMDKNIDKLTDKIDDNVKCYITKKMFMWVNGVIIALIMSLLGYTATIGEQVTKNTVIIEHINGELK